LIITPALDPMHPQYSLKPSSKTFFHFKLQASEPIVVRVAVERMKILEYFAEVALTRVRKSNSRNIIVFVSVGEIMVEVLFNMRNVK
jgi:hypothetical protein